MSKSGRRGCICVVVLVLNASIFVPGELPANRVVFVQCARASEFKGPLLRPSVLPSHVKPVQSGTLKVPSSSTPW